MGALDIESGIPIASPHQRMVEAEERALRIQDQILLVWLSVWALVDIIWVTFGRVHPDEHQSIVGYLFFTCYFAFKMAVTVIGYCFDWHKKPFPTESLKLKMAQMKLRFKNLLWWVWKGHSNQVGTDIPGSSLSMEQRIGRCASLEAI